MPRRQPGGTASAPVSPAFHAVSLDDLAERIAVLDRTEQLE